jgi:hypothetical protein
MMPLQFSVSARVTPVFTSNSPFSPSAQVPVEFLQFLTDGVGLDQADLIYQAERTVLTAANDDLDLSGTARFSIPSAWRWPSSRSSC